MDQSHGLGCGARIRAGRVAAGVPLLVACATLLFGGVGSAAGQPTANTVVPAQAPAREGIAAIGDTHLWYWDTGGEGTPVVLLHPASGSGLIWGYQQPALVKAGYRVIAYSRRSYFNSDPVSKDRPGIGSADLQGLVELLGLAKFHLLGSAAGGTIAMDYALSHPDRLLSSTLADNAAGVRDGEIAKAAVGIRTKGFDDMPVEFRELGPSYRAANPEGARIWTELAHKALIAQTFANGSPTRSPTPRLRP